MKKSFVILLLMFILLSFIGCENYSEDWQQIPIENVGVFKVPSKWTVKYKDEYILIYDENGSLVMVDYIFCLLKSPDVLNELSITDFHTGEIVSSACFSNSVMYLVENFSINGVPCNKRWLEFSSPNKSRAFVIWEETIDEDMITKIANTFSYIE